MTDKSHEGRADEGEVDVARTDVGDGPAGREPHGEPDATPGVNLDPDQLRAEVEAIEAEVAALRGELDDIARKGPARADDATVDASADAGDSAEAESGE